jgi:hypothetical protein
MILAWASEQVSRTKNRLQHSELLKLVLISLAYAAWYDEHHRHLAPKPAVGQGAQTRWVVAAVQRPVMFDMQVIVRLL